MTLLGSAELHRAGRKLVVLLLGAAGLCMLWTAPVIADTTPVPTLCDSIVDDETNAAIAQYILSRQCDVRLHVEPSQPAIIPFRYPSRPTITADICGVEYGLLFDTGTLCCLLQPASYELLPAQLRFSRSPWQLAPLEAKQMYGVGGEPLLDYAIAPTISCASQLYLRNVPLRVYPAAECGQRDYAGAFSAVLLADYLIVVNNTEQQIELHDRQGWQPSVECVMLPLLLLPRGYFVPVWIDNEQYWFHFDTGFSGELGLTKALQEKLAVYLVPTGASEIYSGWRAEHTFTVNTLDYNLQLRPYPAEPWADAVPLSLSDLTALDYCGAYQELEGQGYRIGGILGSGVWQRYNYAIDFRQQRLYVLREAG